MPETFGSLIQRVFIFGSNLGERRQTIDKIRKEKVFHVRWRQVFLGKKKNQARKEKRK